jgi:hypothetical protein
MMVNYQKTATASTEGQSQEPTGELGWRQSWEFLFVKQARWTAGHWRRALQESGRESFCTGGVEFSQWMGRVSVEENNEEGLTDGAIQHKRVAHRLLG